LPAGWQGSVAVVLFALTRREIAWAVVVAGEVGAVLVAEVALMFVVAVRVSIAVLVVMAVAVVIVVTIIFMAVFAAVALWGCMEGWEGKRQCCNDERYS
jgi:hypothetical protein